MAYTSVQSGEIPEGTQYYSGKLPLGDYNFYLSIDATGVSPKIVAKCVSPDGETRTAASRTWPSGTQVLGWSVEANETEASVYATIKQDGVIATGGIPTTGDWQLIAIQRYPQKDEYCYIKAPAGLRFVGVVTPNQYEHIIIATEKGSFACRDIDVYEGETPSGGATISSTPITYKDTTIYYTEITWYAPIPEPQIDTIPAGSAEEVLEVAFNAIFTEGKEEGDDVLVARFAIDIGGAGGYPGGGGGWVSPGDWNIDPTTTLHLTINGALSGRHNDPLTDPSYSYVPADNTTEAGYGCGGDGGHGGGGGGGASTVIAEQFATNKANSKVIVVTAKRHGYGSGGSKGAKGGDGCILIYY